ncbi:hypothetical protein HDU76_003346 [Blyttiomyces sp. JEL0837]|nr:hypothetical protein HDU76_003346 [Blyttiomyces sp. JEL0837]
MSIQIDRFNIPPKSYVIPDEIPTAQPTLAQVAKVLAPYGMQPYNDPNRKPSVNHFEKWQEEGYPKIEGLLSKNSNQAQNKTEGQSSQMEHIKKDVWWN